MSHSGGSLDDYWQSLVTVAMLGTDRRTPPAPPPGMIADVVADALPPDEAARMVATVAAVGAARRAAFLPGRSAAALQPPPADRRPVISAQAAATWHELIREWPVLDDEWMLTVIRSGARLSPDVLVAAMRRTRNDPLRAARVAIAGGPLAEWLVGHVPELAAVPGQVAVEAVAELPALAIPAELAALVDAGAPAVVAQLDAGFSDGRFGPPHRAVLVNLLARCRATALLPVAKALAAQHSGLALALADLCRLRGRMLVELGER